MREHESHGKEERLLTRASRFQCGDSLIRCFRIHPSLALRKRTIYVGPRILLRVWQLQVPVRGVSSAPVVGFRRLLLRTILRSKPPVRFLGLRAPPPDSSIRSMEDLAELRHLIPLPF